MPVFYLDHKYFSNKYYDSFTYLNILQNDFIGNYEFDFGDMPYVKVCRPCSSSEYCVYCINQ